MCAVSAVYQPNYCEEDAGGSRPGVHERPAGRERVRSSNERLDQERSFSSSAEHSR